MPMNREDAQRTADSIVGFLHDRFRKKQFDDFMQNEYADYQSEIQNARTTLLSSDKPEDDASSLAFNKYKEAQNKLFTWAAKYKDNPYIADLAEKHFKYDMNVLEGLQVEQAMHAKGRRGEIEAREVRGEEALIKQREAAAGASEEAAATSRELRPLKAESERALAEKRRADAALASRKEAGKGEFTGYVSDVLDPATLQEMAGTPEGLQAVRQVLEANISRREGPVGKALEQEYGDITRSMGKKYIDQAIKRKEQREEGIEWDYGEDSIRSASALIDRDEAKKEHIRRRMIVEGQRLGFNPQEIVEQNPDLFGDPMLKRPNVSPITGVPDYGEITARLFGKAPKDLAVALRMDNPEDVLNPDKLVAKIRTSKDLSLDQLGLTNTPISQALSLAQGGAGYDPRNPEKKFESYNDLLGFLNEMGEGHILVHVGGAEAEDRDLPAAVREARKNARKIYGAVVEKFAPAIGRQLNLRGAPASKKSDWSLFKSGEASKLIRKTKRTVFGGE